MIHMPKKMFKDDDDFEIDEEFLDGVFDAEKSAIRSDVSLEISRISNENSLVGGFELSPVKRRKLSSCSSPSLSPPKKNVSALRTSEESARLVAAVIQRHNPSQTCQSTSVTHLGAGSEGGSRTGPELTRSSHACIHGNSPQESLHIPVINPEGFFNPRRNSESESIQKSDVSPDISFNLSTSRVRQRKFPGPAGLLPDRGHRSNFSSLMNISGCDLDEPEEPLCSQSSASVLEDGPWFTLLSDIANEGQTLLNRYNVAWVKQKAAAKQLVGQKVPFLAAVLHSIDCSSPDPCVVLRDATGEIPGTLHRSVWDSFGGQLIAGSALVLRLVGVLSTGVSARRHYLNITSNNIVTIYSSPLCESSLPNTSSRGVRKTDVQKWTLNQLLLTVNSWEDQSKRRKESGAMSPSLSRNSNNFTCSGASSNLPCASVHSLSVRHPLHEGNRGSNVTSHVSIPSPSSNNEQSGFVRPSIINTKGSPANHPRLSNSSPVISNAHPISTRPQAQVTNNSSRQGVSYSSLPRPISQNCDPLRQQNTNPENVSNPTSGQSRFVPKRTTFPGATLDRSDSFNKSVPNSSAPLYGQGSTDVHSSRDLFSDGDDIDISSVLDGIDSESLFGDF